MKDAAQKQFDAIEARHAVELAEFLASKDKHGTAANEPPAAVDATTTTTDATTPAVGAGVVKVKKWPVHNWASQARSDLDQFCTERGLSKKGKKEDLVVRLTLFAQEQQQLFKSGAAVAASDSESSDDSGDFDIVTKVVKAPSSDANGPAGRGAGGAKRGGGPSRGASSAPARGGGRGGAVAAPAAPAPSARKADDDDDDDDDNDDDDDDGSDEKAKPKAAAPAAKAPVAAVSKAAAKDDDDDSDESGDSDSEEDPYANETPEQKAERERLEKRRTAVIGCLWRILMKDEDDNAGIHMDELPQKLAENGVKNFRAELVGYKTIEEFLETEQGKYFKFGSNTKLVKLVKEKDDSAQAKRKPNARQKSNASQQRGMKGMLKPN